MSDTLQRIQLLAVKRELRISEHGYEEIANDDISAREIVAGLEEAVVVEDYPSYAKGPCVLVLEKDWDGHPVHALWGIPKGQDSPAVLITAYRPDPSRWTEDLRRRLK